MSIQYSVLTCLRLLSQARGRRPMCTSQAAFSHAKSSDIDTTQPNCIFYIAYTCNHTCRVRYLCVVLLARTFSFH